MAWGLVRQFAALKSDGFMSCGPSQGHAKTGFGTNCKAVENAADFTLVARRNNSFSSGSRFLVLGSLAVVVLAISLGFALNGAWLVFPFAGLDIRFVEAQGGERGRLLRRSHGKEVAFGVHLTGEQRAAVARRLKEHLKIR